MTNSIASPRWATDSHTQRRQWYAEDGFHWLRRSGYAHDLFPSLLLEMSPWWDGNIYSTKNWQIIKI
jgi:hypothetical protein